MDSASRKAGHPHQLFATVSQINALSTRIDGLVTTTLGTLGPQLTMFDARLTTLKGRIKPGWGAQPTPWWT